MAGGIYAAPTVEKQNFPVRKNTRLPEYDYSTVGYYFVTICTKGRAPMFADPRICAVARRCLDELPHHMPGVHVDLFCVMPDHIHAIFGIDSVGAAYMPPAQGPGGLLSRAVQQYKAAVTRLSGCSALWQRGYYDHVIRCQADLDETRRYIVNNPLKERDTDG